MSLPKKSSRCLLILAAALSWAAAQAAAAPTLSVGSGSGQAGTTVNIPISFNPTTNAVAGLQFNLTLPASISTVSVTAGQILIDAQKSVSASKNGTTWTFIIFGLNQTTIANGSLLTAQIRIAAGTPTGTLNLPISNIVYSDPNGIAIAGGTSTGGTVTVTAPPPVNQAPTVNAGTDQSITLPGSANLVGTASDDGLPNPPATVTTTWTKISGPGTVTFGNVNNRTTTAAFSLAGSYVLRLSASDSVLASTDDVTITVNPAPPVNQAPTVNAGTDQSITLPGSANLVGTASDDGLPNPPATVTTTWTKISGPGTVTFGNVNNRTTTAAFSLAGSYVLRLSASDSVLASTDDVTITVNPAPPVNQAPTVNAGTDQSITLPGSANLVGTASDDGLPNPPATVTTTWTKISGPGTVTFGNVNNRTTTAAFSLAGSYVLRLTASDSALSATDDVAIVVNPAVTVVAPTLSVGSGSGLAGSTVNFPISFNAGSASVAGIQFSLTLPASISTVSVTAGQILTDAQKSVSASKNGNTWTFIIFGLNQTPIATGSLLTAQVRIAAGTPAGTLNLPISNIVYSDPNGVAIAGGTSTGGTITVTAPVNQRPTVNAGTDQTITLPSSANLSGSASDDGLPNPPAAMTTTWSKISGPGTVAFGNVNNRTTTAAFSLAGSYVLRLSASDSVLVSTDDVTITVNPVPPPVNQAPTVNAGADQTITLPASANLAGTASDDGLPNPPATVTTTWTKVSGPGTVTFANVNNRTTTAAFSLAGSYVLRLSASDSVLASTDDVTITVNPAPPVNQAPTVNAGSDQNVIVNTLANLSGIASDDGLPNPPATVTTTWSKVSGPGTVTFGNANALSTTASFSTFGSYVLRLTASDGALTATDDVLISLVTIPPPVNPTLSVGSATGMAGTAVTLPVTFNTGSASVAGIQFSLTLPASISTVSVTAGQILTDAQKSVSTSKNGNTWTFIIFGLNQTTIADGSLLTAQVRIAAGTPAGTLNLPISNIVFSDPNGVAIAGGTSTGGTITVTAPANQRPTVNAGTDQSITLPSSANLSGSASDDGLPNPPAAMTTTWSKVSGPGTVTFVNANALSTTASFSQAGSYVLRLTASDSVLVSTDDVSITVNAAPPVNQAPTVNAGTDQTITLPSSATLVGSASDDGLPNPPAALTTTWSKVSGPGTVTFGNVNNRTTTAAFSLAGSYVLRLSASDSVLVSTDDVTITVNPVPPPVNQQPTVNAGTDQTITLPSSANLIGSANDDGLPNPPATMTTTWSKVSGPGTVTFGNANALATSAAFSQTGTYILRLTASDSALVSTDDVTITVNSGVPQNMPPAVNAGSDQTITLPASVNLAAAAIDDGLPNPPAALTTTWSKLSGPGTVTFGNTGALSTTASFSQAGTYVLRLSASDSVLVSTDDVTITVNPVVAPVNQRPAVNAGPDQTITLPAGVNLAAAAIDDGLPNPPATMTTTWSTVSGPGTVTFGNASALSTTASFSQAGSYVLRLTASDSALVSTDDITITVNPVIPINNPPVVGNVTANPADVDSTIPGVQEYAGTAVTYSATISDPDNNAITWQWYYTLNGSPTRTPFGPAGNGSGTAQTTFTYPANSAGIQYTWIIRATDSVGASTEKTLDVSIIAPPVTVPPTLAVGSASGAPGSTVSLPISFNTGSASIAGLQFSLTLPPGISTESVTVSAALTNAGKQVSTSKIGNVWTFVIFGLNQNTIASGQLLSAQVGIAAGTAAGTLNLAISNVAYTDPSGAIVASGTNSDGSITVTAVTPPPSSLPTPTLDLPAYIPVDGTLNVIYPAGYGSIGFAWSITPVSGSASAPSGVLSRASSANFQTPSSVAALAGYGLVPGRYTITVYAFDTSGNQSAPAQQDVTLVPADFANLRVFPNPWRSDRHTTPLITIDHLPLGSTVKLFTASGHFIKSLTPTVDTATWDLTNDHGEKVASGIYLYLITVQGSDGKARGKIVVIK